MLRIGVLLAVALALSGPAPARPSPYCVREASWILDGARQVLHHYDHDVYPADVALLGLQTSVRQFRLHHCTAPVLREALVQGLTRKQRARLLEILPNDLARWFRRVLYERPRTRRASVAPLTATNEAAATSTIDPPGARSK